ncbi:MAG: Holliday junction DNA helicase RuvA [Candidatus Omnitrophica bacterium]|nr:Holliday junction DNA helicase RuvA [Candidatus Omnitrophota bacterium]
MISRICGKIKQKTQDSILLDVGGICYEIFIPPTIMKIIDSNKDSETDNLELITYHYSQIDPSKSMPVLIGFLNEIEKEFFEKFITVSGIGPKAALRALSKPISEIAKAIDEADYTLLKSLPGIGMQRAKEIVAKLQGKVGKFALIQDSYIETTTKAGEDARVEALQILLKLQYNSKEANDMINKALKRKPDLQTAEEILNEVYKQKSAQP